VGPPHVGPITESPKSDVFPLFDPCRHHHEHRCAYHNNQTYHGDVFQEEPPGKEKQGSVLWMADIGEDAFGDQVFRIFKGKVFRAAVALTLPLFALEQGDPLNDAINGREEQRR